MERTWRLLDTGVNDAATNMCLDQAVLEARARDEVPDTVRFLQFSPPAVLVGYHQSVDLEVRVPYCEEHGIDINRRLTGGGAIFFDRTQLGWEVIAGKGSFPGDVLALNERVCRGAIAGLRHLGVEATFRPVNDIEVGGRKISGTGGTESGGAFLFQGTLLVDFDVETMVRALRVPTEKLKDKEIDNLRDRVTCLDWLLGRTPPLEEIKAAMARGFAETFGVELVPAPLDAPERAYLEEHLAGFTSAEWVHRVRRPMRDNRLLYSVYKAPGGLIRTSVLLDGARSVIKYIMLTGDFFAYPESTVLDLEAALKNCRVAKAPEVIRGFYEQHRPDTPGVEAEDLVRAVDAALRKRDLSKLGLSPEEARAVHEVNDALEHLEDASVVLLPYCAKWVECDLRYDEDCIECGGCTVGVVYELAHRANMEPITIVNYEHLMSVLDTMRERGVSSYLGCCCEPFFAKHREDMEAAGVSGLIIGVEDTSCYELDQEREAKLGEFDGETTLKVDLLRKLFDGGVIGGRARMASDADCGIKVGKADRRSLYAEEKGLEEEGP